MDNINQTPEDIKAIFRIECEEIIRDFAKELDLFEQKNQVEIITKLMRDAHSIKGSAGIAGFVDIQKTAHKIEDKLSELKIKLQQNDKSHDKKFPELIEVRNNILFIAEELKRENSQINIYDSSFYSNILKQINLLKSDITISCELAKTTKILYENAKDIEVVDIAKTVYLIFTKLQNNSEVNSNVINTLSGTFKIIKKIVADNNQEAKEELFFVKQRLSVTEQMLSSSIRKSNKQSKISAQNILPDILKILGQESIKTLRIDTTKLDNLYENVIKLENKSKTARKNYLEIYQLTEKMASMFFEIEKISTKLSKEKENLSPTIANEVHKLEKTIKNVQKNFSNIPDYDNKDNKEFIDYLNKIQDTVKNIRILPIGVILHMFPRMVRDIAQAVNKEISMEIKGSETGVDKKILEEIKTPLIHLLRNAVDHGIELPEVRKQLGKPILGKITISAKNQGEKFIISVSDDGCGINFDKIKEKALKEKLLKNNEMKKYKRQDFLNMIFKPGFSTEDTITELSGRGMGLDIVYTKISSLNGQIKINTQKDKGTEIIMTIPSGYFTEKNTEKTEKHINKNIMIVDDSITTIMYFSNILKKQGYNVYSANNAKDALKELKNNSYDLLISDFEMPNMNGLEFVDKVKKSKKIKELPIVILSMIEKDKLSETFKGVKIDKIVNKSECSPQKIINYVNKLLKIQ